MVDSEQQLPPNVAHAIVHKVGRFGFCHLWSPMRANKVMKEAAYIPQVLKDVDLSEFISNGRWVNFDLPYHHLLHRCVLAWNPIACLMEGLRLVFAERKHDEGLMLMDRCVQTSAYAIYAMGFLQICGGEYRMGWQILARMKWWEDIPRANRVMQTLRYTIEQMNPLRKCTFRYFMDFGPKPKCNCEGYAGTCEECFIACNAILLGHLS